MLLMNSNKEHSMKGAKVSITALFVGGPRNGKTQKYKDVLQLPTQTIACVTEATAAGMKGLYKSEPADTIVEGATVTFKWKDL